MKIPKELFAILFKLHSSQPWLHRYEDQLIELMNECADLQEQELIVNLLDKFCYLDSEKHAKSVERLCQKIAVDWHLDEGVTQIVACTADSNPDSGQQVGYEIRTGLGQIGWQAPFGVNRYDRAQRNIQERRHVVLVDEFVGTGQTMVGRVETMRRQFEAKDVFDAKIYVIAYAGMEFALENISRAGCEDVFFAHSLKKGITELSPPDVVGEHLNLMGVIESRLAAIWNGVNLPRLGYSGCEALYGRHLGNAPNSVFPVFWWPILTNNVARQTIFIRR
jgi:hypothetical protein